MVAWFIARKYLSSRFITIASFLLVSLSVAILIILLAVMEGFRSEMIERIRGTSADIKVRSTRFIGMDEHARVEALVEEVDGVRATVPYVDTLIMYKLARPIGLEERTGHLTLEVLDLRREARVGKLDDHVRNYSAAGARLGIPQSVEETLSREWIEKRLWETFRRPPPENAAALRPVILGAEVFPAYFFRNLTGYEIELTSISPVTSRPCTARFVVAGYFRSRDVQQDTQTVLMDLADAVDFLALRNAETGRTTISGLRVFLEDGRDPVVVKRAIATRLQAEEIPFIAVRTWQEEKKKILRAVRMEKTLVGIILGVIIVFVGLTIFIIMTVQIVEKTRDLGVLQAIGFTPFGIVGIYSWMGAVICMAGIALGTAYGVGFCLSLGVIQRWVFVLTGLEVFPRTVYYIDTIPVRMALSDFAFIIVPTVVFSFLASLLAAARAARIDPLEALRYE